MNVYVGNLPSDTTEEDLRRIFEPHGLIASIIILKDKVSARPLGFAFIDMPEDEQLVSDYMTTEVEHFGPDTNLIDLCDHLLASNYRLAPITEDGTLRGIVSRSDLIRAILRIKRQELPD